MIADDHARENQGESDDGEGGDADGGHLGEGEGRLKAAADDQREDDEVEGDEAAKHREGIADPAEKAGRVVLFGRFGEVKGLKHGAIIRPAPRGVKMGVGTLDSGGGRG